MTASITFHRRKLVRDITIRKQINNDDVEGKEDGSKTVVAGSRALKVRPAIDREASTGCPQGHFGVSLPPVASYQRLQTATCCRTVPDRSELPPHAGAFLNLNNEDIVYRPFTNRYASSSGNTTRVTSTAIKARSVTRPHPYRGKSRCLTLRA